MRQLKPYILNSAHNHVSLAPRSEIVLVSVGSNGLPILWVEEPPRVKEDLEHRKFLVFYGQISLPDNLRHIGSAADGLQPCHVYEDVPQQPQEAE